MFGMSLMRARRRMRLKLKDNGMLLLNLPYCPLFVTVCPNGVFACTNTHELLEQY